MALAIPDLGPGVGGIRVAGEREAGARYELGGGAGYELGGRAGYELGGGAGYELGGGAAAAQPDIHLAVHSSAQPFSSRVWRSVCYMSK